MKLFAPARPLMIAAALGFGGGHARAAEPASPEPVTLQLKWHHQFQFAGYYAAQAQGFYAAEGLAVTLREGRSGSQSSLSVVLAGTAQFGISDTDVLLARLAGQPVVVCAAIFQHSPSILLSRRDRQLHTPADLVGTRVMLGADQGDTQFRAMLRREGIHPGRLNIVPHTWNLADLIEGRVDAMSGYISVEPAQLRARGIEPALLRSEDYGVDFYGDTLFTTAAEIAAHPARVAAFVRASLKGWDYAFRHPEEIADQILAMDGVAARGITRAMLLEEARDMRALRKR